MSSESPPRRRTRPKVWRIPTRRDVYRWVVSARRFVVRQVLHADDPPHRLALGVGIGMFVMFTPTIGMQSAIVVALAWLLGANKLVGLPLIWISNPATFVPIYYPCYRIGRWIMGGEPTSTAWWKELASPPEGRAESLRFYWGRMLEIIGPLTLGGVVVGAVFGTLSYVLTYQVVVKYRALRARRLLALAEEAAMQATDRQPD